MTREEKISELINIRDNFNYTLAPREVFDDAIKALEQEPCEDCISRQAVDKIIKKYCDEQADVMSERCLERAYGANAVGMLISDLPSVNIQPKTGRWIEDENEMEVRCSVCGEENDECSKFCPNYGCRMEGEIE